MLECHERKRAGREGQGQGLLLAIPSDKRTIGTVQSRPVLMQWDPAGQIALPHHWVPTARGPQGQALSLLLQRDPEPSCRKTDGGET